MLLREGGGRCRYRVQQIMDQPGMVANLSCGQMSRENDFFFLSPSAPENMVSRDSFGCHVLRQPSHSPHPG